jgi:hypothetical protein
LYLPKVFFHIILQYRMDFLDYIIRPKIGFNKNVNDITLKIFDNFRIHHTIKYDFLVQPPFISLCVENN